MLTEFDKKLLFALDKDGRASFTDIAKDLGSSPQVVKYHFQCLLDEGIIKHFWAFVDYDKADYSFFWGYLIKFTGLTKEIEQAMYTNLSQNKYIPIIMRCDGYVDVMLGIIGKDVFHHNEVLQSVFATYGQYIASSEMVVGLGFHKFPRTYLVGKTNDMGEDKVSGGAVQKIKLSELDRKIISLLQGDGRIGFTDMAKKLFMTPGMIQKRYKRLAEQGVIAKITYTLGYEKMGFQLYRVLIKIIQFDSARTDALYQFCLRHKHIVNYVKSMGSWELMLDIEIENRAKLRDIIRELQHQFKDIVSRVEINEVYKIDKFTQMAVEFPELG